MGILIKRGVPRERRELQKIFPVKLRKNIIGKLFIEGARNRGKKFDKKNILKFD